MSEYTANLTGAAAGWGGYVQRLRCVLQPWHGGRYRQLHLGHDGGDVVGSHAAGQAKTTAAEQAVNDQVLEGEGDHLIDLGGDRVRHDLEADGDAASRHVAQTQIALGKHDVAIEDVEKSLPPGG